MRPNTAILTGEVWLFGGTLTGRCDLFPRTKGRLKRTKTRTDSATASGEAVLHMKDVFM